MSVKPDFQKKLPPNVYRKTSVVESFYNPLDTELKRAFKDLWKIHFDTENDKTFYNRLAKPNLEDYGLILYFLEVPETDSHVKEFFTPQFKSEGGVYPTYKHFLTSII